jgi:hypothetical protein
VAEKILAGTGIDWELAAKEEERDQDPQVTDAGKVLAIPCGPWCWDEPVYYLRTQPGKLSPQGHEVEDIEMDHQLHEQMAQFKALEEEHALQRAHMEKQLRSDREKARQKGVEVAKSKEWEFKGKLADEYRRLEAEERRILEEARAQLPQRKIPELKDGKAAEKRKLAEASFQQERERLEELFKQAKVELEEATQDCKRYAVDAEAMQNHVIPSLTIVEMEDARKRAREAVLRAVQDGTLDEALSEDPELFSICKGALDKHLEAAKAE